MDSSRGVGNKPAAVIASQFPIKLATHQRCHVVPSVRRGIMFSPLVNWVTTVIDPLFIVGVRAVPSICALDQIE